MLFGYTKFILYNKLKLVGPSVCLICKKYILDQSVKNNLKNQKCILKKWHIYRSEHLWQTNCIYMKQLYQCRIHNETIMIV